eukprot:CFRG3242T1
MAFTIAPSKVLILAVVLLSLFTQSVTAIVRTYYIAAEEIDWDYASTGTNLLHCTPFSLDAMANVFMRQGDGFIGKTYMKAVFRGYTDDTYTTPIPVTDTNGFMGPVIKAEVGDSIVVVFQNNAGVPYSVHPHGVTYDKDNEGALYGVGGAGSAISPGEGFTYTWNVEETSGPGPSDGQCILWAYHSHVLPEIDMYAGLVGPLVICNNGTLNEDGTPIDGVQEVFSYFSVTDENASHYIQDNLHGKGWSASNEHIKPKQDVIDALVDSDDFAESNLMHNINGYMFGNNYDVICARKVVRWYVFAYGTEVDLHTAHWHGATVLTDGHRSDVIELLPATFRTVELTADSAGEWIFHCHVNDHNMGGMSQMVAVLDPTDPHCISNDITSVEVQNRLRAERVNGAAERCVPVNSNYTVTLPVPQPLGFIGDEVYMSEPYEDFMKDTMWIFQDLAQYGRYLSCPAPKYCNPQYFSIQDDIVDYGLAFGLSVIAAAATLIGGALPFFPCIKKDNGLLLSGMMALAVGVMIWIGLVELYFEGLEYLCCSDTNDYPYYMVGLFFAGVFIMVFLDILIAWVSAGMPIRTFSAWVKSNLPKKLRRQKILSTDHESYHSPRHSMSSQQPAPIGGKKDYGVKNSSVIVVEESQIPDVQSDMQLNNSMRKRSVESNKVSCSDDCAGCDQCVDTGAYETRVHDNEGSSSDNASFKHHDTENSDVLKSKSEVEKEKNRLLHSGVLTAIALAIHNFPEGAAAFFAASADRSLGIGLCVALVMHNIPEGFMVSMPIYVSTGSKFKGMLWATLSGLFAIIGAFFAWLITDSNISAEFFGIIFAMTSGLLVYIAVVHLVPLMLSYDPYHGRWSGAWVLVGMFVMAITLAVVGANSGS